MALIDEIAAKLSGRTRAEENIVSTDATTRTYVGTATSDSSDGSVYVALSEDVTMPDDYDGEHGVGVEMPTTVGVSEGDEVLVTVFGGGTMKAPVVTGNPGWGDAVQEQVANAESIAEQAEAVASATGQHFWYDEGGDGAHVTQVTREEWEGGAQTGPNSLWNSQGMLFRDGSNDLLALLPAQRHSETFEGDGTTTTFTLSRTPTSVTSVTIPGVTYAEGTDYTVSGSTITFATAPESGDTITVRYTVDATETFAGDGSTTDFTLSETPDSIAQVTVNGTPATEASAISVPFSHELDEYGPYWKQPLSSEYLTTLGDGWVHFECDDGVNCYFYPSMYGLSLIGGATYPVVIEVRNWSSTSKASITLAGGNSVDAFSDTLYIDANTFSDGTFVRTLTATSDQSSVIYLFGGTIAAYAYVSTSFDMRITVYDSTDSSMWALSGDTVSVLPAPASGSTVAVSYDRSVTDTLAGDGSTTSFTLSATPSRVEFVGVPDEEVTGYTLSNRTLTLTTAPDDGAEVVVDYKTGDSSVTIFDGDGNGEDNITSVFSEDYVRIGGKVPVETDIGGSGASIEFFDQTDTHTSRMDAFTSIVEDADFYDMRNETSIATSLDDNGRVVDTDSNGTASLQLKQELSYGLTDVDEQTSEVTSAIVADATYDADGTNPVTSHAAVRAVALTGSGRSTGYSVVDIVAEQGIGIGTGDVGLQYVSTPQVVCALLHPSATYTAGVGTWTGVAGAWQPAGFGVVVTESGSFTDYINTANKGVGEFTALVGCTVRVAACVTWVDSVAGRRSVGAFVNATRSGNSLSGGTEYSNSGNFYTGSATKTAQLTPVILHLAAGNRLNIGKFAPSGAVQSNQAYKMNWVTIEVLSVD